MLIDLHTHSTASDGTKSPSELIRMALETQPDSGEHILFALTDHDTVAGVTEFKEEASHYPERITAIAGVEISSEFKSQEIHILGYGIDPQNKELLSSLKMYRDDRDSRNARILAKMNDMGFDISMDDLRPSRPGASIGRPAIASWFMNHGYVSSVKEAFDRYLGKGKPCYIARKKPSLSEALSLIHNSGGIAVLAHPVLYKKLSPEDIIELIATLKSQGLAGIEVYYSRSSAEEISSFGDLADQYHLIKTGGTDYHGAVKPDLELFVGTGNLKVPDSVAEPFLEHLA